LADLTISIGKHRGGSVKLGRVTDQMKPNIRRALVEAGALLDREMKGRAPYLYGRLQGSITLQIHPDGMGASIGPNTVYAAIQNYGGWAGVNLSAYIPPQPYIEPSWEARSDDVFEIFVNRVFRGPLM